MVKRKDTANAGTAADQTGPVDQTPSDGQENASAQTTENTVADQTGTVDQTASADQVTTETGVDQTGAEGKTNNANSSDSTKSEVELITVSVRHTTIYPVYRRAGLVLRGIAKEERVTAEQLETLKADPWVEVKEVATK
jgi:hypothetical protein